MTEPVEPTIGPVGIVGVLWRLMRNQPIRYGTNLIVWTVIWSMPIIVGVITQRYFDGLDGGGGLAVVLLALAAYIGLRVAGIITGMRLYVRMLFRARAGLMRNMLGWIFTLPGARPVAESPGEVVSRFRDDSEHTIEALDFSVDFVGAIVSSLISFVILIRIDPVLTAAVFVPIVFVVGIVQALGTRIRRYRTAARQSTEAVTGFLGEAFGSVQSVKVAGAEQGMLGRFGGLNDQRRRMMVRDRTLTATSDALVHNTVSVATGVLLLLAVGALATDGPDGLSVGEFALFTYLLTRVTFGAHMSGRFLARARQADVSVGRMVDLMAGASVADLTLRRPLEHSMPAASAGVVDGDPAAPLLSVTGLCHRHPGGADLGPVDLEVWPGQFVVITGRVGSGKTTLLRTILGLLPADGGEVRWQGVVVEDPATFMVPPNAAYTPQVPRLFSMDLRDNLSLGRGVDDDVLRAAMSVATLDQDLAAMPDGLDTLVGPRGLRLSGGQVQRSAAARMLVGQPRLLVFDDLSSALDVQTEAELWAGLFADDRATTALVVSHRRPALARADVVLVMEEGRVVARGTADELRESSPAFRQLWGEG